MRDVCAGAVIFGRWIAEARRLCGKTQAQLGRDIGVSQSTISRIERGLVPGAQLWTIAPLLLALLPELLVAARHGAAGPMHGRGCGMEP